LKKTICILLCVFMVMSIALANAEESVEGIWVSHTGFLVTILKLNSDKTSSWAWAAFNDDVATAKSSGTWKMNGNELFVSLEAAQLDLGIILGRRATFNIDKQTLKFSLSGETLFQDGTTKRFQKIYESGK